MILRRVIKHVKHQHWFAIGIDLVIVVLGVFIGMQVSNWNQQRVTDQQAAVFTQRLTADLREEAWGYEMQIGYYGQVIATARRATEVFPLAKDKYFGVYQLEGLAEIEAHAGAPDEAIKILGQLLAMPAGQSVSVERLKRDPLWDPLRKDPRFQALLGAEKP